MHTDSLGGKPLLQIERAACKDVRNARSYPARQDWLIAGYPFRIDQLETSAADFYEWDNDREGKAGALTFQTSDFSLNSNFPWMEPSGTDLMDLTILGCIYSFKTDGKAALHKSSSG